MKPLENSWLEELRRHWKMGSFIRAVEKIRSEASKRCFFRVFHSRGTCVAMVYPEKNPEEVERICRLSRLYRECGIAIPEVIDIFSDRIVLQEDVGDGMLQRIYPSLSSEKKSEMVVRWVRMLGKISCIDPAQTRSRLDDNRMNWELEFFQKHFIDCFPAMRSESADVAPLLRSLVGFIEKEAVFAHRDFHTRNMLLHRGRIYLVDFQDSLVAPPLYDLVSLAFDAYCDLKSRRELLLRKYDKRVKRLDRGQFLLTALQRNIKALGTFAYQVHVCKNLKYRQYIPRTLRYVLSHLRQLQRQEFLPLEDYFLKAVARF